MVEGLGEGLRGEVERKGLRGGVEGRDWEGLRERRRG